MKTKILKLKFALIFVMILSFQLSFSQLTLIDINGGPPSSSPTDLEAVGTIIFFSASDPSGDVEPFAYDGVSFAKFEVNTTGSSFPAEFTEVGGDKVFFSAEDETGDRELYVIDSMGTLTKIDVDAAGSSMPFRLTNIAGTLFFTATVAGDKEAFSYDGFSVTKIDTDPAGSGDPEEYTFAGGFAFFVATAAGDEELYKYDGMTLTKVDINASGSSDPNELIAVGPNLYFNAESTTGDKELHVYDTAMSTVTEIDVSATGSSSPFALYTAEGLLADGILYFTASDLGDVEMYEYDPFTTTLSKIDIDPVGSSFPAIFPGNYVKVGTSIFVPAEIEATGDRELYEFDTIGGTTTKIDVNPGGPSAPLELTELDGMLYFTADEGPDKELYKYDGALTKIELNSIGSGEAGGLTPAGSILYLKGTDGMAGVELFEWIDTTLGIVDFENKLQVNMFPNPVKNSESLSFNIPNGVSLETIDIYTINGVLVESMNYKNKISPIEIPISHYASGLYLVTITSSAGSLVKKLIVE